jgi:FkbM family methyltransferase
LAHMRATSDATLRVITERLAQIEAIATSVSEKIDSVGMVVPLGDGLLLARNRLGFVALNQADAATVAHLAQGTLPEPGTLALVEMLLKPGDCFIDIGANVGIFTLAAAGRVGHKGHVLACEPTPATARALRTTVQVNNCTDRVRIEEVAVGRQSGRQPFHLTPISGHNSLYPLPHETSTIEIEVRSLDELTSPGSQWSLAKIDVEGAELEVLAGMARLLSENPDLPIIVEFGPSHFARVGSTVEAWLQTIRSLGLTPFEIDADRPVLRRLRSVGLEEIFSINLLLVRDLKGRLVTLVET